MKITIPGSPIPKARSRRRKLANGQIIDYDPQEREKKEVAKWMKAQKRTDFDSDDVFSLAMVSHIPIPKSDTMPVRNAKLWGLIPHSQKPDNSNLLKFYEDAGNSILYRDDSLLCEVSAKKKWSDNPRTEINIVAMKKPKPEEITILSHLSPKELYELAYLFLKLPKINDICVWEDLITEDENRREAAAILSEIADKFASKLQKISKKCPGYWERKKINESKNT